MSETRGIVRLNVGGNVFETTRTTLIKYDCMFRTMLESNIPLEKDSNGCIFIDRDPTHFRLILNFMRDERVKLPDCKQSVIEIMTEAEYYLLDTLVEQCQRSALLKPAVIKPSYRVVDNSKDLLDAILKDDRADVMVLYYPENSTGTLPKFDVKILDKYIRDAGVEVVFCKYESGKKEWHHEFYQRIPRVKGTIYERDFTRSSARDLMRKLNEKQVHSHPT